MVKRKFIFLNKESKAAAVGEWLLARMGLVMKNLHSLCMVVCHDGRTKNVWFASSFMVVLNEIFENVLDICPALGWLVVIVEDSSTGFTCRFSL